MMESRTNEFDIIFEKEIFITEDYRYILCDG